MGLLDAIRPKWKNSDADVRLAAAKELEDSSTLVTVIIDDIVDERFKLAVNLFETDEFYDLENDPYEMQNLISDSCHADDRDRLHDALLDEMDRTRDPFRSYRWGNRTWRSVREPFYSDRVGRRRPDGFPFQAEPHALHEKK